MKDLLNPKKLPFEVLIMGILSWLLRRGLYTFGMDEKGLLKSNHPMEIMLWLVTILAAALIILTVRKLKGSNRFADNFRPSMAAAVGHVLAAAGIALTVLLNTAPMAGAVGKLWKLFGILSAPMLLWAAFSRVQGQRPFVLTRACCAGSQRYCSGWTGDNHSMWGHIQLSLVQMMNLGLSGMYMTGSDVGGFGSDCTPELLVRWTQAGCLSPFFRNHYAKGTRNQEPYAFDQATLDACRKAIDLRYHLLPYIYDLAHEDLPILRPLVMEYPDDPTVANICDQYLIGENLLVAPVISPGTFARSVYLPKGVWYDYYTGKRYTGGKYILAEAPMDHLPLFARAGAVIPVSVGKPQSTDEITEVALEVFPGNGSVTHYTDDGETMDYAEGKLHALKVTVRGRNVTQTVVQDGYEAPAELEVVFKA